MDFPIITRLLLPCVSLRLSPKDQGRKRRGLHGARRCPWGSPHPGYFTYAGVHTHTHTQHQSSSLRRGPSKPRPAPSWRQDTEHTCKPRLSMCVRPGPQQVWPPGLLRESNLQDPPLPCNRVPGSSVYPCGTGGSSLCQAAALPRTPPAQARASGCSDSSGSEQVLVGTSGFAVCAHTEGSREDLCALGSLCLPQL